MNDKVLVDTDCDLTWRFDRFIFGQRVLKLQAWVGTALKCFTTHAWIKLKTLRNWNCMSIIQTKAGDIGVDTDGTF